MKSPKLEEFINKHFRPLDERDREGHREYGALRALLCFLEDYPGDNRSIVLTKNRLHNIFGEYFNHFEDVEFFIAKLSYRDPCLFVPRYFFEDEREEVVELTASDVFKYISNRSNIDPISGELSEGIAEFIFIEYFLNEEAV